MKTCYIVVVLICFTLISTKSFSQGMWTWMSGPNIANQLPVFGTQSVGSITNRPAADYSPYCWTDLQGNFWLYGGVKGYADMWKYDPLTNEWTWVQGNGMINVDRVAGTQG